jgi:hypothetical protein
MYFDPIIAPILALIAGALISYGLYERREIRKLDRIIAEKEAALNATDHPASTAR